MAAETDACRIEDMEEAHTGMGPGIEVMVDLHPASKTLVLKHAQSPKESGPWPRETGCVGPKAKTGPVSFISFSYTTGTTTCETRLWVP